MVTLRGRPARSPNRTYDATELEAILGPRLDRAFRSGAVPAVVRTHGVRQAATRWGDARKALTLFRQAGETANERGLSAVTPDCIDDNLEQVDNTAIVEQLSQLPLQHLLVLTAITSWTRGTGEIVQPVTTAQIQEAYEHLELPAKATMSERGIRDILTYLETMDLIETWVESKGRDGRVKQAQTTFDPTWVADAKAEYSNQLKTDD